MYVDFDTLPDQARVWVYQANRSLSDREVASIREILQPALSQWAAHGQPLLASAQVIDNRFIVLGVDEGYTLPSGCSIDSSVRTLQEIGRQISSGGNSVDFFDRSAAVKSEEEGVIVYPLSAIKAAVSEGKLTPDTPIVNTLVKTKAEFLSDWTIRAGDSWLKRYFKAIIA